MFPPHPPHWALNVVCICSKQRVQGLSAEPGVVQSGGCSRRRTTSGSQCKSDARADDPAAQAVAVCVSSSTPFKFRRPSYIESVTPPGTRFLPLRLAAATFRAVAGARRRAAAATPPDSATGITRISIAAVGDGAADDDAAAMTTSCPPSPPPPGWKLISA